ncbi:amidohydrolase family protein [uncultured Sphaerochaeta sp.]|uniref:amidohydrolase family protein n=1 Tax=uncultured Sphaerochaeta sp. TaxID=886478 RepID=UPI002A0A5BB2|nr:amidohydrolase family protein [uncultured Sphaerochaeta sp.]
MSYFFDQHFHVMTLEHPNLLSLMSTIKEGLPNLLTSGALSPSYILTNKNLVHSQMLTRAMNTLITFDQPIGQTFAMMEDDLQGKFQTKEKEGEQKDPPFIHEGKMHFRDTTYDKMAMCPLLMDFSQRKDKKDSLYYPPNNVQKILKYAEDTLEGIDWYHKNRPEGLFEFFPLIGITPPEHNLQFIGDLLETYIAQDKIRKGKQGFFGIKFYPPLGYNPWPTDEAEKEKVCMIYDFCEKNSIPIITHCDDQGFRTISTKKAWLYTSPASYKPVLEHYPSLKLDFAHYGWQYNKLQKNPINMISAAANNLPDSPWFYEIIELMQTFPQVYADVSFSGTTSDFYIQLDNYIKTQNSEKADIIRNRTMFGSDFCVNLFKVESYSRYYQIFEQSPFSNEEINLFVQSNPLKFMGIPE